MILSMCFYKQTLVKQCFTDLQGSSLHFIWFFHTFYLTNWMKLKMKFMRIKGDYTSYHDEMTKWCIAAVILCLDTSHRTSSVDKPQYTWAYMLTLGNDACKFHWMWQFIKKCLFISRFYNTKLFVIAIHHSPLQNSPDFLVFLLNVCSLCGENIVPWHKP